MFKFRTSLARRFSMTSRISHELKSKIVSSCLAGTPLNLQIKKSGPEIIAQEDSAYPEWLWTVLDPAIQEAKLASDPLKKRKKELRKQNRNKIKQNNFLSKI